MFALWLLFGNKISCIPVFKFPDVLQFFSFFVNQSQALNNKSGRAVGNYMVPELLCLSERNSY